jgi:hypothetical protein
VNNLTLFDLEKFESVADFKTVHLIPGLNNKLEQAQDEFNEKGKIEETADNIKLLKNEIQKEQKNYPNLTIEGIDKLEPETYNTEFYYLIYDFLQLLEAEYLKMFELANQKKEDIINYWLESDADKYRAYRDAYHNESVGDIALKVYEKNKIIEYNNEYIQQFHPVYQDPVVKGNLDFRSHFLAPRKHFLGMYFETYWFNVSFIWLLTILLYITLYYEHLKKLLGLFEKIKVKQ